MAAVARRASAGSQGGLTLDLQELQQCETVEPDKSEGGRACKKRARGAVGQMGVGLVNAHSSTHTPSAANRGAHR